MAAYGWQLCGWMIGLGVGVLYFVTVLVLNHLYLFRFGSEDAGVDDMVKAFQRIKWVIFVVFMIGVGLPSVRIVDPRDLGL